MAYTTVENITVYCANAAPSGTVPAAAWQSNRLWQGALYLPHEENIFNWSGAVDNEYVVIAQGSGPSPTAYYTQLLTYCPHFRVINAVANGAMNGGNGVLAPLFAGLVRAVPGVSGAALHIVTKAGSPDAYVYQASGGECGNAFPAVIGDNGELTIDASMPLCLPRLTASAAVYRFYGCLLHNGLREDGTVGSVVDCAVYGAREDLDGVGRRTTAYFFRQPETYRATAAFLNRWLVRETDRPNSFLKGFVTGRRLGLPSRSPADAAAVAAADAAAGETGTGTGYDRDSFLAGLCAGRCTTG